MWQSGTEFAKGILQNYEDIECCRIWDWFAVKNDIPNYVHPAWAVYNTSACLRRTICNEHTFWWFEWFCKTVSLRLRNCLSKMLERDLVIQETHKPEVKVIKCYYLYVLLGWLLYILTLVDSLYLVYWNHNLQKDKDYSQCSYHIIEKEKNTVGDIETL